MQNETQVLRDPGVETTEVDINGIKRMIPHQFPFLMIDKLVDVVLGERATGIKCVTSSEPHFQGHFPEAPIMPGVLIIEAMAQTAAALVVHTLGAEAEGKMVYFMTIDGARFRRPVVPGDVLKLHVQLERNRGSVWKFSGQAKVENQLVAEATYSAMIRE